MIRLKQKVDTVLELKSTKVVDNEKNDKKRTRSKELSKLRLLWGIMVIGIILIIGIFVQNIKHQIVHKFKSPSFSGVNTSSHYLTLKIKV